VAIIITCLNTWESRGGSSPGAGTTGLYHLAILYPTRSALADALQRLIANDMWGLQRRVTFFQGENFPMIDPEPILKARLRWVKHYEQSQNAALSCRRCGISKATLLKWWRRYQDQGEVGLLSQSRRPHKLRERKVTPEHETLILELRRRRHLGPKGLQRELLRLHQLRFSTRTIWKILHRHGVWVLKPLKRHRPFSGIDRSNATRARFQEIGFKSTPAKSVSLQSR
jgi:transposase